MRPGETPVPIPNTMVKARAADGTMPGTAWESRWLPEHTLSVLHLEKSIQTERDFLFDEMQRKTEEAERERKAWAWPMHGAGMTLHAVRRDRSSRKGTGRMPWH